MLEQPTISECRQTSDAISRLRFSGMTQGRTGVVRWCMRGSSASFARQTWKVRTCPSLPTRTRRFRAMAVARA